MSLPSVADRLYSRVRSGIHLIEESIRRWSSPDIIDDAGVRPNLKSRRQTVIAPPYEPGSDTKKVFHQKSEDQRKRLAHALMDVFLFKILTSEQMEDILDAMEERQVKEDEEIVRQGDEGDYLYVIDRGCFKAFATMPNGQKQEIFKYDNKGSFGELALMYYTQRQATVVSATEGTLWTLDRDTFRRLVLNRAHEKRLTYDRFLRTVPMLQTLTVRSHEVCLTAADRDYERMNVADALTSIEVPDGRCIICQGDAAVDGMYFVEEGRCRVTYRNENGTEHEIGQVGKGQYFGEFALITNHARYASVFAVGHVKLAFLDVSAFERLLGPCVQLMKRNIALYEEQLAAVSGSKLVLTTNVDEEAINSASAAAEPMEQE